MQMKAVARRLSLSVKCRCCVTAQRSFATAPLWKQNATPEPNARTTHFGFQTVSEAEKEGRVGAVFSSVAASYDTMNDLMSVGIHRLWKDHFVRSLDPGNVENDRGWNILDIAGGTGDIAFRMLDHATKVNGDLKTRVTVSDINENMLAEGRKRALNTVYADTDRIDFKQGNAESLDFVESDSVDLYTVAFGIRNFTNKSAALREAFRVLKPGGVFACLEFSHVNNALLRSIYKRWSFGAIPLIGQLVAGDRDSYQYLVESIEQFPIQEDFKAMIEDAGFIAPGSGYDDLTGGIASIHRGVKPYSSKTVPGFKSATIKDDFNSLTLNADIVEWLNGLSEYLRDPKGLDVAVSTSRRCPDCITIASVEMVSPSWNRPPLRDPEELKGSQVTMP